MTGSVRRAGLRYLLVPDSVTSLMEGKRPVTCAVAHVRLPTVAHCTTVGEDAARNLRDVKLTRQGAISKTRKDLLPERVGVQFLASGFLPPRRRIAAMVFTNCST